MPLLELLPDSIGGAEWNAFPVGPSFRPVMDLNGPDGDATYIASTGNLDNPAEGVTTLIGFQKAPALPHPVFSVAWVGVKAWLKRATIGAIPVRGVVMSGEARVDLPTVSVTSLTYQPTDAIAAGWRQFTDPETGKDWTWPAALAAEVGLWDTKPDTIHEVRCTTMRKLVWVEYASRGGAAVRYDTAM